MCARLLFRASGCPASCSVPSSACECARATSAGSEAGRADRENVFPKLNRCLTGYDSRTRANKMVSSIVTQSVRVGGGRLGYWPMSVSTCILTCWQLLEVAVRSRTTWRSRTTRAAGNLTALLLPGQRRIGSFSRGYGRHWKAAGGREDPSVRCRAAAAFLHARSRSPA